MKKLWIALIAGVTILVVAAIMIFAVPTVTATYYEWEPYTTYETYSEWEPYTTYETYSEWEPHTTYETYWESEPYTEAVPIDYLVTDTGIYNWFWQTGSDVWVTIKNADVKSGYFYVTFNLVTQGDATATEYGYEYIAIGEEKDVLVKHSGDYMTTFTYSVTPPTKEVTRYRDIEKTREVTTYEWVEKTREVTEYGWVEKTEKVTVFEYLTR